MPRGYTTWRLPALEQHVQIKEGWDEPSSDSEEDLASVKSAEMFICSAFARRKPFYVLFIGGPGSGKVSLGRSLGKVGFSHIAVSDIFRVVHNRLPENRPHGASSREQTLPRVLSAIAYAVAMSGAKLVSFDGFRPQDIRQFEEKVGKFAIIVESNCTAAIMLSRTQNREASGKAKNSDERVRKYLVPEETAKRNRILMSYDKGRGVVRRLDSTGPLNSVSQELFSLVGDAAESHQLDIRVKCENAMERHSLDWLQVLDSLVQTQELVYNRATA